MKALPGDLPALVAGGKAALARCLSALESAREDPALVALLDSAWRAPKGIALGLTGPPGVGKSTLANSLIAEFRARGQTVAVVAVDPSSAISGGALLGDRARIESDPGDSGIFVRSMAAGRHLGGLAAPTFPAVVLMRACFDWVLVETVGIGQSETEITDCADLVLLCVQPGSGDSLQFMKAGVMEVPDLVLVTKGDLGGPARRAASDLRGALSLATGREPPRIVARLGAYGRGAARSRRPDRHLPRSHQRSCRPAARPGPGLGRRPAARIVRDCRSCRPFPDSPQTGLTVRVAARGRKSRPLGGSRMS